MASSDENIAIAAYYRPGILSIRQLLNTGYTCDNIRVVTHDTEENRELLQFLKRKNIQYTVESLEQEETRDWLFEFDPDVLFSLYYREKVPKNVLERLPYGGVNVHPSLLPKYRGVLSVPWAMVNGDDTTGFTYHYMTEEFDAGNIILQEEVPILPRDTAYSLYHRIIPACMNRFLDVLELVVEEEYRGYEQSGESSYHGRGELPNDGFIDPSWDDEYIDRFIRAMYYPPHRPAVLKIDGEEREIVTMEEYKRIVDSTS
jgi:methionyl-tRNA formyltransferase